MFNIAVGVYALGFLASVFFPYLEAWLEDNTIVFDWRYVISRFVGSVIPLLFALASPDTQRLIQLAIESHIGNDLILYIFVFISGYGGSSVGRLTEKTFKTIAVNTEQKH